MPEYNISEIARICGEPLTGDDRSVRFLLTDSRRLISPEDTVFFALPGKRQDGHDYIEQLYEKGVRSFIINKISGLSAALSGASYIRVNDTLKALQIIASYNRNLFQEPVIGITGSNGKTIIKEWLFQCLSTDKSVTRSPKSYNSQIGVPLSVWFLEKSNDIGIFEAGISRPGEMENLRKIIIPTIGIFANIGEAHQENFKSYEQKIEEKLKLFTGCKTLIYCKDHELIDKYIISSDLSGNVNFFKWSLSQQTDLSILRINKSAGFTIVTGVYQGNTYDVKIPFLDRASIENAVHVWAALLCLGVSDELIQERLSSISPVAMRLEIKQGINNCTLINDSYNSDINSLAIALDTLNMQSQHTRKSLILSDMLQTGRKQEDLYKDIAELTKEKGISRIIGIGEDISANATAFNIPCKFYLNTDNFIERFESHEFKDEAILLKGSRQFEFEKISALIEYKTHLTRLEINIDALIHNLYYYRSLLEPETGIMVMVKAFSYGSGSYEIANILQFHRVDYLAVAFVDEGVSLRQAGITLPIMVMSPEPGSFDQMIEFQLEPEIYSFRTLDLFYSAVKRNQEIAYPVHIKIESGMHRLGFMEYETGELCDKLKNLKNIRIVTVFSHLAATDEPVHDKFTREQIARFDKTSKKLEQSIGYKPLRHILNSSGIERFPEAQYDMVRLGIGLYGSSAANQDKLQNVSSLKSTISQVKKVKADETVGYGRMGKAKKEITIGVIPIGYADGLDRKLGNGNGKFLIGKKFVRIIGNVCMDMCMVDISGLDVNEGEEVIIFGDDYPISELAKQLNTIPYEILTSISGRVKRIYFHD
jgi:alanine racemase